jgi:hypothetical protein
MTHCIRTFCAALAAALFPLLAATLVLASPKFLQARVQLTASVISHCTISTSKKPPAPKCTPNSSGNGPAQKSSPRPGAVDF